MFITKKVNYKDFIPSEQQLSDTNKLLSCQDFGFTYNFVDTIVPAGEGSIDMIFNIMYRSSYEKPEALIPVEKYQDIFLEFLEWYKLTHFGGFEIPFIVFESEDFILIDELYQEPFKLILPKGTLIFKGDYYNTTIEMLKAFWSWSRYKPGSNQKEFVGYSKTKDLFIK